MKIMDVNEEIYARMRIFVEHKQKAYLGNI